MKIHEGSRRMQRASQWLIAISICAMLVVWLTRLVRSILAPVHVLILFIPLAIPGAALWIAGWIVEGFVKDTRESGSPLTR